MVLTLLVKDKQSILKNILHIAFGTGIFLYQRPDDREILFIKIFNVPAFLMVKSLQYCIVGIANHHRGKIYCLIGNFEKGNRGKPKFYQK